MGKENNPVTGLDSKESRARFRKYGGRGKIFLDFLWFSMALTVRFCPLFCFGV